MTEQAPAITAAESSQVGNGSAGAACARESSLKESMSLKTEWRPIETRPKDERSTYLVCTANGQVAPWINGVIHNNPGTAWDWNYGESITHWMPLPAPPSSTLILEREEAGGEIADSSHLAVPTNGPESLSTADGGQTV